MPFPRTHGHSRGHFHGRHINGTNTHYLVVHKKMFPPKKETLTCFREFQPIEKVQASWWIQLGHQASQGERTSDVNFERGISMT